MRIICDCVVLHYSKSCDVVTTAFYLFCLVCKKETWFMTSLISVPFDQEGLPLNPRATTAGWCYSVGKEMLSAHSEALSHFHCWTPSLKGTRAQPWLWFSLHHHGNGITLLSSWHSVSWCLDLVSFISIFQPRHSSSTPRPLPSSSKGNFSAISKRLTATPALQQIWDVWNILKCMQ